MHAHMNLRNLFVAPLAFILSLGFSAAPRGGVACGDSLPPFTAFKDNTLFQYVNDGQSTLNSNGSGDFIAAGCTNNRNQIQRGLLQFNLSGIPVGATVNSVQLSLYVVNVPKTDDAAHGRNSRPFWLVPLSGLADWGEGSSAAYTYESSSGGGAYAQTRDATWYHTQYDPTLHGPFSAPNDFSPGQTGYWAQEGALGNSPYILTAEPSFTAGYVINEHILASTQQMKDDVQAWVNNPSSNLGWILVGDESVILGSSKRGFASKEYSNSAWRPQLTVDFTTPVPEPSMLVFGLSGLVMLAVSKGRRCLRGRLQGRFRPER